MDWKLLKGAIHSMRTPPVTGSYEVTGLVAILEGLVAALIVKMGEKAPHPHTFFARTLI